MRTGDPTGSALRRPLRRAGVISDPYVAACPVGTLGIVPGPSPCSIGGDGGISTGPDGGAPIDALFCGGSADDAALAVAGLAAPGIWVSRIEGIVTRTSASDVPLSIAPTPPSSPAVTASGYESICEEASPSPPTTPPTFWPPSGPTGSFQPPQQSSNSSASSAGVGAAAAEGCSGAADACGSSQSTDDESEDSADCGGDSSTGNDDACSGDASSSSDCATGASMHRRRGAESGIAGADGCRRGARDRAASWFPPRALASASVPVGPPDRREVRTTIGEGRRLVVCMVHAPCSSRQTQWSPYQ